MPPHPEGEENHSDQADDGNQRVEQSAEELRLLGKWVGSSCVCERERNKVLEGKADSESLIGSVLCYICNAPHTHIQSRISKSIP